MKFIFSFLLLSSFIYGQSLQKAQNYLDHSDYKHAVPLFEKITKEAKLNQKIDLQVMAQNGLADCYMDLGANYKAKALLKANLHLLEKQKKKNFLLLAQTHQWLAICYDKLSLIEDYLTECHLFYSYYKKAAPDKEIYKGLYYAYLGRYYNMRYLIDKAFYYTNTALQIYHKHKKEHLIDDYVFYNAHLFTIRNHKEDIKTKLKYADSLHYFVDKRYPYNNLKKSRLFISIAAINLDLAYTYSHNLVELDPKKGKTNTNKAIAFYTRGIAINNKFAGYYYAPSAHLNSLRGLMYFYMKDYIKALENYNEGINRLLIPGNLALSNYNNHSTLLGLLNWKAWCLDEMFVQQKDPKLLYEIEKTLLFAERIWKLYASNSIKQKRQYETNYYSSSPYPSLIKNYYKLILTHPKSSYINNYFEYVEKSKYYALFETLYKEKYLLNSVEKNYSLDYCYLSLEHLLLKLNNKITLNHSKETYLKKVNQQIAHYHSKNANLFQNKTPGLTAIQNKLKDNEAILNYNVVGIQTYYTPFVLMITKTKIKLIRFKDDFDYPDKIEQLDSLTNNLKKNLISAYKKTAFEYYKKYFQPIESYLPKTITHIQIIPTTNFGNLPFDILLSEPSKSNDFSKLPYLLKKYQFSYGLSSSIASIVDENSSKSTNFSIFSPSFSSKDKPELKKAQDASVVIANLYDAQLVQGKKASKKLFTKHLESDRLVALLSHGSATNDEEESNKGIYLSDGFLSLNEVYGLKANCDFLLLGACETGVGFKSKEGTINLGRAFTAIGVKSMLLSSWAIDEQSSIQIIRSFLKYLDAGYTKSEALQKAKLDYLHSASPRTANPLYWAGLNITGNNENICLQKLNYWWWGISGLLVLGTIGGCFWYYKKNL